MTKPVHTPKSVSASPSSTTWAMLLAKWTDFAKASVALPEEGESGRVKRAVPALIGLQSVTSALAEVDQLPGKERAAGITMGEVLVRQYAAEIHEVWRGEPLHPEVEAMIRDARQSIVEARAAGFGWVLHAPEMVGQHPAELVAQLLALGFGGDAFVVAPGVRVFAGCPVGFARDSAGGVPRREVLELIEELLASGVDAGGDGGGGGGGLDTGVRSSSRGMPSTRGSVQRGLRQAYRQFDFGKGGPVRDLVVPEDELPAGQPLLVPAMLAGEAQPVSLPIRGASEQAPLPVVWEEGQDEGATHNH